MQRVKCIYTSVTNFNRCLFQYDSSMRRMSAGTRCSTTGIRHLPPSSIIKLKKSGPTPMQMPLWLIDLLKEIRDRPDDFSMTHSEWDKIEKDTLKSYPRLKAGLDAIIMTNIHKKPDLSISFMDFIRSKGTPNVSTQFAYLTAICEKYEDLAVETFEELERHPNFDSFVSFHTLALNKLLNTRIWKKVMTYYLKARADTTHAGMESMLVPVLAAALKNKDYLTYYQNMLKLQTRYDYQVLDKMLFELFTHKVIAPDIFLELLKVVNLKLSLEHAEQLMKFCRTEWSGSVTCSKSKLTKTSKKCRQCKNFLQEDDLNTAQLDLLKEDFRKNAVISKNIYMRSSPKELQCFDEFMAKHGPFDIVIDGLNVGHIVKELTIDVKGVIEKLQRYSLSQKCRILVVLKKYQHTQKIFPEVEDDNVLYFYLDRMSMDDDFIMLAAMMSGPHCYIVSNDQYKDHMFLVSDAHKSLFMKWQTYRQITIQGNNGRLHNPHNFVSQETDLGWHVPFYTRNPYIVTNRASVDWFHHRNVGHLCIGKKEGYRASDELQKLREAKQSVLHNLPQHVDIPFR